MIPIEDAELVDEVALSRFGTKPKLIDALAVSCSSCPRGEVDSVKFVAAINRSGHVVGLRVVPVTAATPSAPALAAAADALRGARFQPALLNGKPQSDWTEVVVAVFGKP